MDRLRCTFPRVFQGHLYHSPASVALLLSACFALIVGSAVYLLHRDWATTLFLAPLSDWQPAVSMSFGPLGDSLPSLTHAYAFALLLILMLGRSRRARLFGALSWLIVAWGLECLQADVTQSLVQDWLGVIADMPVINSFQIYIVNGHFDAADLLASALGALLAYLASSVPEKTR